jgi:hypothetical protein
MPSSERGVRACLRALGGGVVPLLATWGPAVGWMACLFLLSSWPGADIVPGTSAEWIGRKLGHFTAYAFLAALLVRALLRSRWPLSPATALAAVLLAGIYGVSDETHQMYVNTRIASWLDAAVDTLGAGLGAAVVLGWLVRKRQCPKS